MGPKSSSTLGIVVLHSRSNRGRRSSGRTLVSVVRRGCTGRVTEMLYRHRCRRCSGRCRRVLHVVIAALLIAVHRLRIEILSGVSSGASATYLPSTTAGSRWSLFASAVGTARRLSTRSLACSSRSLPLSVYCRASSMRVLHASECCIWIAFCHP